MGMMKLKTVDHINPGDLIKARDLQKSYFVPVQHCIGFRVGDVDLYMDPEFEGFYRPLQ